MKKASYVPIPTSSIVDDVVEDGVVSNGKDVSALLNGIHSNGEGNTEREGTNGGRWCTRRTVPAAMIIVLIWSFLVYFVFDIVRSEFPSDNKNKNSENSLEGNDGKFSTL
jgi:hypothetical protein